MSQVIETINNNYNEIINTFINNKYYSKMYSETNDIHFRKLIDSVAILQAYQKYDYDTNVNYMIVSLLYNIFNLYHMHVDVLRVMLNCTENTFIAANEVFANDMLYTNKYDVYCISGNILNIITIEQNMKYYCRINLQLNDTNVNNITFFCSSKILNNIILVNNISNCLINNISYKIVLQTANIYEYCFNEDYGNFITIHNIKLNEECDNSVIQIDIPLNMFIQTSIYDIQLNVVLLENKFIHSEIIEVKYEINKYLINIPKNYKILNIIKIIVNDNIQENVKENINGWYLTYENDRWFININIQEYDTSIYVEMMCYNDIISYNNLQPLQYIPCSFKYVYLTERINMMNKNYLQKIITISHGMLTQNINSIFEILKIYVKYNNIKYNIQLKNIVTIKYINNIAMSIVGLLAEIESNIVNIAFKLAMNEEIYKYKNIVEVKWI